MHDHLVFRPLTEFTPSTRTAKYDLFVKFHLLLVGILKKCVIFHLQYVFISIKLRTTRVNLYEIVKLEHFVGCRRCF